MLISRQAVAEYLDRDFDDFTWMKRLPRERVLRELDGLRVKPAFKTEPWTHQLVCFYVGLLYPRFLFLLKMGLGKSKILSDLITQTRREKNLEGALITVPRLTNIDSWVDDLAVHSDLEPWPVNCSDTEEKWERLLRPRGDVTLIDYAGLHLALSTKQKARRKGRAVTELVRDDKKVKLLMQRYNWLGLDESHMLRNHENLRFGIIDQMSKRAEYVYGSTGTLFGKNVEDLWAQFFLVDRGETFGENLGPFRKAFFTAKQRPWSKGVDYVFDKGTEPQLHRMLQHRSLRYDDDEVPEVEVPRRVAIEKMFTMGDEQREHYLRALEGLINAGGGKALDGAWLRMRQIVSGYLAWSDEHGDHVMPFKHNPKLDGLEALVEGMGDGKVIICYDYTETGRMIVERLRSSGVVVEWLWGGAGDKSALMRRFKDPRSASTALVMNSEAGGTGNDGFQKVCRYMLFYESPPAPITREQTERRVVRPGGYDRAFIYDLIMRKSLDRGILDGIKAGVDCHASVVNGRQRGRGFYLAG